jgi:peptidyl-prolyl cis-trans isomerase A (cyclophilin A)
MRKTLAVLTAVLAGLAPIAVAQSSAPKKTAPAHAADAAPPVPLPEEPGTYAVIYTSMGNIVCRLFPQEAPKAVANFVGLATGTKPWTDPRTGKSKRTPLYTGTTFHRVIPDFMIQGGDPIGDGTGDPGYQFDDEISPNRVFDHPGILAMANHGKNTNGSQFFITVAPAAHLNGGYTVFGEVVSGQEVADAISKVERDENDRPNTPVKVNRIAIRKVGGGAVKPSTAKPAAATPRS